MRWHSTLMVVWAVGSTAQAAKVNSLPPIRIGISNVQTGALRSLGQQLTLGSMAYFKLVNDAGGVHGRQIEVLLKDDKYEPDTAVQNTNDLVTKDKVFFLFDYVGTPTLTRVLPLLSYYAAQKIVNVTPFTGADPHRKPPYDKYVFNIRASYFEETHSLVDYLYAKGYRKIGFLGQADSYGRSGELGVEEALRAHGLKIVGSVTYPHNQPYAASMAAQVELLRAKGADAVISVGVYEPCGGFIRDARLRGWQVPIANLSIVNARNMLELLRKSSEAAHLDLTGNLFISQVVPSPNDSRCPLVNSYRAHVREVNFTSLEGWLNAVVVTEVLRRAGRNPDRGDFIQAMESLHGWDPGIGYKLNFSHSNHQGMHKIWLMKTEHAQWTPEPTQ